MNDYKSEQNQENNSQKSTQQDIIEREEYLSQPWKDRMEKKYGEGQIEESLVKDNNSLRWFIYNLNTNDNKEVKTLQKKLNDFYETSGFEKTYKVPEDGQLTQRTTSRIHYFNDLFDKHLRTDNDSREALRHTKEMVFWRNNPFTEPTDTVGLKQRINQLNVDEPTGKILKDLELIPK